MATPNYGYEKRQRELAKKQKKEDKARAKAQRQQDDAHGSRPEGDDAGDTSAEPQDPPASSGGGPAA